MHISYKCLGNQPDGYVLKAFNCLDYCFFLFELKLKFMLNGGCKFLKKSKITYFFNFHLKCSLKA